MGHGHHEVHINFDARFEMGAGLRKFLRALIVLGLVFTVLGVVINMANDPTQHAEADHHAAGSALLAEAGHGASDAQAAEGHGKEGHGKEGHGKEGHGKEGHGKEGHGGHHAGGHHGPELTGPYWLNRLMVNVLQNGFFFLGVGLLSLFFVSIQYATNGGWFTALKRVPESFARFIPIGWGVLMLIWVLEMAGVFHLHPWTDATRMQSDALLGGKDWYLNTPFFVLRQLLIVGLWVLLDYRMRKLSTAEDELGGIGLFRRRRWIGSAFIVVFALSWSLSSFDWMLATDPHWFSTMFAVHMFAGTFVSTLALLVVVFIYLKNSGYMPFINEAHLHDLGKFVFGFSVFWTYIWFGQFMLIWYANIPEETFFFYRILQNYPFLFAFNLLANFVFPFLALMTNTSKRRSLSLGFVCIVIFITHWVDFFLMVNPSVLDRFAGIGFTEIGVWLLFLGGFLWVGFRQLTKVNLVAKKHPYLQESLQHYY